MTPETDNNAEELPKKPKRTPKNPNDPRLDQDRDHGYPENKDIQEEKGKNCGEATKLSRVMQIYSWMLNGYNTSKLHERCREQKWGVSRRQVSRYILDAAEIMKEDLESYRDSVLPDLIAKYLFLYERSMERDQLQADWLAKAVLDSLSKFFHLEEKLDSQEKQMSRHALIQSVEKLSQEVGIDILVQGKRLDVTMDEEDGDA